MIVWCIVPAPSGPQVPSSHHLHLTDFSPLQLLRPLSLIRPCDPYRRPTFGWDHCAHISWHFSCKSREDRFKRRLWLLWAFNRRKWDSVSFVQKKRPSRLLACPGYYKQCCDEHWGTRVSFNSGFRGVYAQQWDCGFMLMYGKTDTIL